MFTGIVSHVGKVENISRPNDWQLSISIIKSLQSKNKSKAGLGLGIFIGKTLLEKNKAKLLIRNSETRGGAEIKIEWLNKDLISI